MRLDTVEKTARDVPSKSREESRPRSRVLIDQMRPGRWGMRCIWALYAVAVWTATHLPLPPDAKPFILIWDKAIHFTAYFFLAALTTLAFPATGRRRWLHVGVWLALFGLAAIDELTQPHVGRTADIQDWLCDAAGIILAVSGSLIFRWIFARSTPVSVQNTDRL